MYTDIITFQLCVTSSCSISQALQCIILHNTRKPKVTKQISQFTKFTKRLFGIIKIFMLTANSSFFLNSSSKTYKN